MKYSVISHTSYCSDSWTILFKPRCGIVVGSSAEEVDAGLAGHTHPRSRRRDYDYRRHLVQLVPW